MDIFLIGSFVTLGIVTFCLAAYIVLGVATGSFIVNKRKLYGLVITWAVLVIGFVCALKLYLHY